MRTTNASNSGLTINVDFTAPPAPPGAVRRGAPKRRKPNPPRPRWTGCLHIPRGWRALVITKGTTR